MKTLIFGTTYIATQERQRLTKHWIDLHRRLNPECDFLLIDSASPLPVPAGVPAHSFADNIGHFGGWGRAWTFGLQSAISGNYDCAVHIEGDSLLRLPVAPIIAEMERQGTVVASVLAGGGRDWRHNWVETGLMFFDVPYLCESRLIERYDWENRVLPPYCEVVMRELIGGDLKLMPWRTERSNWEDGRGEGITLDNVGEFDWITHCRPEVYERFMELVMEGKR